VSFFLSFLFSEDFSILPVNIRIPPEDLKKIIDKTAEHVLQHGAGLEDKVRQNKKDDSKFAFLEEGSQFSPYYRKRLRECKGEKSDSEVEVEEEVDEEDDEEEARAVDTSTSGEKFSFIEDSDFRSFLEEVEQKSKIPLPHLCFVET